MRRKRRLRFCLPELLALALATSAAASPQWLLLATAAIAPITISSDFGEIDCSSGAGHSGVCASASGTKTLSVPASNPGVIHFVIDRGATHICKYSKNGGAFTTFSDGQNITFANGDTLVIQITQLDCGGDGDSVTINDNTTNAYIANFTASNQQVNCGGF